MLPRILIFVPGFPGEAIPRHSQEIRVVDVISKVVDRCEMDFEIISYPGIKDNCQFTFEKTLPHTLKIIQKKIEAGYSITLVGQSWGGLISLLASSQLKIDRLLLITPYVLALNETEISNILAMYSQEFPLLISSDSISQNTKDVLNIFSSLEKIINQEKNTSEVRVLAGVKDEVVSIDGLKSFFSVSHVFNLTVFTETNNDHDFSYGKDDLLKWLNENV